MEPLGPNHPGPDDAPQVGAVVGILDDLQRLLVFCLAHRGEASLIPGHWAIAIGLHRPVIHSYMWSLSRGFAK